jgi:hypothetical protein
MPCVCRGVQIQSAGLTGGTQDLPEPLLAAAEGACAALAAHLPVQDSASLASAMLQRPAASTSGINLAISLAETALQRMAALTGEPQE